MGDSPTAQGRRTASPADEEWSVTTTDRASTSNGSWSEVRDIGQFGLRERADRVGAVLDVLSAPGAGTTVRIPLQEPG